MNLIGVQILKNVEERNDAREIFKVDDNLTKWVPTACKRIIIAELH